MFHSRMKYKRNLVLLFLICSGDCINVETSCDSEGHDSTDNFAEFYFGPNYKSANRPLHGTGTPIVVYCEMEFITLSHIDIRKMTTGFLLWLRMSWEEPRFRKNFTMHDLTNDFNKNNYILWTPLVMFDHAYKTEVIKSMKPALSVVVENKTVTTCTLMSVEFYCPMDLSYYPFDVQTCPIQFVSSSLLHSELMLKAFGKTYYKHQKIQELASEYSLKITELDYNYEGLYATVTFELQFTRIFLGHLYSTFIPSVMFVLISSLSLLIPIQHLQPRMTVQVTTILTIVALSANIKADLPPMNGPVRGIDLWFLACFSFGFLNLIITIATTALISSASKSHADTLRRQKMDKIISFLENNSLIPVLIIFGIFVLFYWIFYLVLVSSGMI